MGATVSNTAVEALISKWKTQSAELEAELKSISDARLARNRKNTSTLDFSLPSVPYVGDILKADLILLMLNPSVTRRDRLSASRLKPRIEETILQKDASPCFAFDRMYWWTDWFNWYVGKFSEVISEAAIRRGANFESILDELAKRSAILELVPLSAPAWTSELDHLSKSNASQLSRKAAQELLSEKPSTTSGKRLILLWWGEAQWGLKFQAQHEDVLFRTLCGVGATPRVGSEIFEVLVQHLC